MNLSSDPIIERILTPRCALTAAEYLAFEQGMHVLVIMTDMTTYCRGPARVLLLQGRDPRPQGLSRAIFTPTSPRLYERAGIIEGRERFA